MDVVFSEKKKSAVYLLVFLVKRKKSPLQKLLRTFGAGICGR